VVGAGEEAASGAGSRGPDRACPGGSAGMDRRLAELVEELTTSGQPRLEPGRLRELKKICRYGGTGRDEVR